MWRNRSFVRPDGARGHRRLVRAPGGCAGDRRLRRRLDQLRRLAVPRLAGHRPLPHLPVRRGRAVRRRSLPDADRGRPSRHRRQEQRRLRRHGHADAAPGPVRRARHPRRRRALRGVLPARVRAGRRGPCATSTAARTTRSGPTSARARAARSGPMPALVNSWCMAACYSTDADGTVRLPFEPTTGRLHARDLGSMAGVGPGAHGRPPRRCAARPARDLDRRRPQRRVLPRPRGARRSVPSSSRSGSASRSCGSSSSTARTPASTWRYPDAIGWLAERLAPRRIWHAGRYARRYAGPAGDASVDRPREVPRHDLPT